MIETRLLNYFLAVAREESITRAAQTLYITQSTLSKQMMELEQQLGHRLFVRGKRTITLTEEGRFLRNRAQEILDLMDSTESAFRAEGTMLSGDISIACGETAGMEVVAEVFRRFHTLHPDVRLRLYSGDAWVVTERLDKGLADLGLLLGAVRQERFDYFDLGWKDTFGLLMRPEDPLAAQQTIRREQLPGIPLIMSEQILADPHSSSLLGISLSSLPIVATYSLIYNATFLTEKGIGCAFCLDRLGQSCRANLVFRPIVPEISVDLSIATKKYTTFSPAVRVFLDMLRSSVTHPAPEEQATGLASPPG